MWGRHLAFGLGFLIASLPGCSSSDPSASPNPIEEPLLSLDVPTAEGPVHGTNHGEVDGVRVFRGIPYAKPPVGELRWKKPQPVTAWTEQRDATQFGKRCPQPSLSRTPVTDNTDEDCLSLNVYTPAKGDGTKKPVMVWMHGGAFTFGSARDDLYDAAKLVAASGAIVVTINYRLGVLGFLSHPALQDASDGSIGNYGLWDQREALLWVQRNAAAFGGDPGNVTIFGESAGAVSVSILATSPVTANKGLFHRVIIQSGAAGSISLPGVDVATKEAADLAKAMGCADADFACLRSKSANELVVALGWPDAEQPHGGLFQGSLSVKPWLPIGDSVLVPSKPGDAFANGSAAKVPYLLGTNKKEGGVFHAGVFGDKKLAPTDDLTALLKKSWGDEAGAKIADRYPLSAFGGDANEALARIDTLALFVCPTRTMARNARDAGNPTFLYTLSRTPNGGLGAGLGPVHAVDLVFLFDSDLGQTGRAGDDARDLVAGMQGYWTSFAKSGAPARDGALAWPAFGADEKNIVLDVPISAADSHEKADCDFWDGIPQAPLPATYLAPP